MSKIKLKCDICGGFFQDINIEMRCGYCKKKEKQELIGEFQSDLDSLSPDIPHSFEKLRKLRDKWEERRK